MASALRHAAFRRLAFLYTLNSLLEWFTAVALMVVVYGATDSALAAAGMLLAKQVMPGLAIAPISKRLDAIDARASIMTTALAQVVALIALMLTGFSVVVFPAAFVLGLASALTRGAVRASVAKSLPAGDLRGANATLNYVMCLAGPVAPVLAGALISWVSVTAALALAAAGLALVAVAACGLRLAETATEEDESEAPQSASTQPTSNLPLAWLFLLGAIVTGISAIDEPSLLAFTEDTLGIGVTGYTAIFAAQAVGIAAGSVVFNRLIGWPMLRVYALAGLFVGVGFLVMGMASGLTAVCVGGVLVGVGTGMDWVAIVTAVQEATARTRQAQSAARIEAAGMIGPGVGLLVGALIAELGSPRLALLVPGGLSLAVIVAGWLLLRLRATSGSALLSPSIPGGAT